MHDLVALETATSDYVESNSEKLINFHKMVLVSNILEQILRVTQEHPDIHPKKEVFKVIRVRRIVFVFSFNYSNLHSTNKSLRRYLLKSSMKT